MYRLCLLLSMHFLILKSIINAASGFGSGYPSLSLVEFLWCPPLIECSKSPPKSTSHVRHSEQFSGSRVALEYF
jgi:hypothetical protein